MREPRDRHDIGSAARHSDERVVKVIARRRQNNQRKRNEPVREPYGPLPHVDWHHMQPRSLMALSWSSEYLRAGPGVCVLMPLSIHYMNRAGQARIERMHCAQDLQGRFGSAIGVFNNAASYAPRWPLASRGPAFQVLGTTA